MATTMDVLELEIVDNSKSAVNGLDLLSAALNRLKIATANIAGLNKVSKALAGLSTSFSSLQNINLPIERIKQLTGALQPLTTLGKSSFNSLITGLSKVSEVTKTLAATNMNKFAAQIQRVADAMRPLANEAAKVYVGLKWLPGIVNKVIGANGKLATSNHAVTKSYNAFGVSVKSTTAKFGIMVLIAQRMGNAIGGWIEKSNSYIENLNLFNVSMGKYAQEALDYAQKINKSMGIDTSEWIRNQGIIMDMSKSFGVAENSAYKMSKALTQLAYDYASLYNIKVSDSMLKLQSALAGEIEPVRRLGKDISVAKLQMVLFSLGIDRSVESLAQSDKAMLRTIALLQQSTSAMGDFAKTIDSPANQMRIFSARIQELSRALGNLFLPILAKIIPYVIAFVEILTDAVNWIAVLLRFELPKFDFNSKPIENIGSSVENVTTGLEDAAVEAKKLKGMLAGFDELNIIQQEQAETKPSISPDLGGAGIGDILGSELDSLTSAYDKLFSDVISKKSQEIKEKMMAYLTPLIPFFQGIGTILKSAWDTLVKWNDQYFYPWLVSIGEWMKNNPETLRKIGEWVAAIGLAFLGWKAISSIVSPVIGIFKALSNAFGAFKTGGAIGKLFAAGGLFTKTGAIATGFIAIFGKGGVISAAAAAIGTFLAPIGTAFAGLAATLGISVGALAAIIVGVIAAVAAIIIYWDEIKVFFTETIPAWWNGTVVPFFQNMWSSLIEGTKNAWTEFKTWFGKIPEQIGEILGRLARYFVDFFTVKIPSWIESAKKWFSSMLDSIKEWGANTWAYLSTEIPKWISFVVTWFSELPSKIWAWLVETYNSFIQWGEDLWSWASDEIPKLVDEIVNFFINLPSTLYNIGADMISGLWDGIKSVWEGFLGWWDDVWSDFKRGFEKGFNSNVSIDADVNSRSSINGYASGGFPASGEVFMARENGIPEMVGAIGSRTAVANNDQIVSGITGGVSKANEPVVAAIHAMANGIINAYINNQPIVAIGEKEIARVSQAGTSRLNQLAVAP